MDVIYEWRSITTPITTRKKLYKLRLQSDTPLIKHLETFDELITELLTAEVQMSETDKIAHLLSTLPALYDSISIALETLSKDRLTLVFLNTRLLDHERKLRKESSDINSKVLHAQASQSFNEDTIKGQKVCSGNHGKWKPRKQFRNNNKQRTLQCH